MRKKFDKHGYPIVEPIIDTWPKRNIFSDVLNKPINGNKKDKRDLRETHMSYKRGKWYE